MSTVFSNLSTAIGLPASLGVGRTPAAPLPAGSFPSIPTPAIRTRSESPPPVPSSGVGRTSPGPTPSLGADEPEAPPPGLPDISAEGADGQGRPSTQSLGRTNGSAPGDELFPGRGDRTSQERSEELERLEDRDRQVRLQQQTRLAVGAGIVRGTPEFRYEIGPDGRRYAVAGHVEYDLSPVTNDPRATIAKMERVRLAALASPNGSFADRRAAVEAARLASEAERDIEERRRDAVEEAFARLRELMPRSPIQDASTVLSSLEVRFPGLEGGPPLPQFFPRTIVLPEGPPLGRFLPRVFPEGLGTRLAGSVLDTTA